MEIKTYNKKELEDFVVSDLFRTQYSIPISYHRAISQINNPYCSDDDILLWAAYKNTILVGYVGVLPDLICNKGVEEKVFWLSCFWVDDNFREKNLASQLLYLLLKQYKNQLYISNFLFSLEKMYQDLGIFQPTQYLHGQLFFRKLDLSNLLAARFPKIKPLIPVYLLAEKSINLVLDIFGRIGVGKNPTDVKVVESLDFDDELQDFLTSFQGTDFIRTIKHFDWIVRYPWVLEGFSDNESKKYYFSSKSVQFEYRSIKLYDADKLVGYVFARIRDRKLTLGYVHVPDCYINGVGSYLLALTRNEDLLSITCFDGRLFAFFNIQKGFILKKKERRPFIFPKKSDLDVSIFQEGDGDSIFT